MVVDYGASGLVCRIQLPAIAAEPSRPGVLTPQAIDNFLLDLLPRSMRGKELHRMVMAMGSPLVSTVEYENLRISRAGELLQGAVTVSFKTEECSRPPTP